MLYMDLIYNVWELGNNVHTYSMVPEFSVGLLLIRSGADVHTEILLT